MDGLGDLAGAGLRPAETRVFVGAPILWLMSNTAPRAGSVSPVILLDYHPQTELDASLAEDLRRLLRDRGYRPVDDFQEASGGSGSLSLKPSPEAVLRIASPKALRAGFTFRGFGDLPVFTIGIRDGDLSAEPFAADVVWDPSVRIEGGEGSGTSWEFVLREALEFVERATASLRGAPSPASDDLEEGAASAEETPAAPPVHDPTPLHLDTPATVDHLNRRGFARALAVRLDRIWGEMNPPVEAKARRHAPRGSFVLHLHGEWGSGKSSLLEMLRAELAPEDSRDREGEPIVAKPWAVIDFNAWQNQRLDPPWWPLLDAIYRQPLRQRQIPGWRRAWSWLREQLWRFTTKRRDLLIFAVLLVLCGFLGYRYLRPALIVEIEKGVGPAGDTAAHVADIAALVTLVGGWLWFGSRSLVSGTARAAQSFVESVADPMDRIQRHFTKMVGSLGRPIAVFVDDLDRCQPEYVVKLLEGIQTLFRDPRVVYVVAADQRWLHTCFERSYEPFAESVREPGRRLGSLFLEKAFEISVEVPRLSKGVQAEYWKFLLGGDPGGAEKRVVELEREARAEFEGATSEQQVISRLEKPSSPGETDPLRENVRRQVAVERLANAAVERSVTYFLQPFAPLLEPNPRSMKRFLNAYAIQRDLSILAGQNVLAEERRRKKLALWVILSLRWPSLGERLLEEGTDGEDDPSSRELAALRESPEVRSIVEYLGREDPLTLDDVAGLLGTAVPPDQISAPR